jgi:hypothetical protein
MGVKNAVALAFANTKNTNHTVKSVGAQLFVNQHGVKS